MQSLRARLFAALALAAVFFVFHSSPSLAANGKIAGVVKDKETGEPLPGANVVIVGTNLGGSTDIQGRYFILNVPPGVYTVQASFIGYQSVRVENVRVRFDETTTVDFELSQQVIEVGEAVTVVAERPLIEKTLTASKTTIGTDELDNKLPVGSLNEVIETVASTFNGYIRGGRIYESKTLLDGVDITDTYFSGGTGAYGGEVGHTYQNYRLSEAGDFTSVQINQSSVQELNVFAGTFGAEYPSASAGVINVVTREGGTALHGKLFTRTNPANTTDLPGENALYWDYDFQDDPIYGRGYVQEKAELQASGNPDDLRRASLFTWTPESAKELYDFDATANQGLGRSSDLEVNVGGPLLGSTRGGFFITGRYSRMRKPLPFDRTTRVSASAKLHYYLKENKMKLTLFGQLEDGGKLFDFVDWKYNPRWKYYMEGAPRYKSMSSVYYAKLTHTLSSRTFYELQISQSNKASWAGYPDDNGNGFPEIGETGDFITFNTFFTDKDGDGKYTPGVDEPGDWIKYVGGDGGHNSENGYVTGDTTLTNRVFFYEELDNTARLENKPTFAQNAGWYRTAYPPPLFAFNKRNVFTAKFDITSQVTHNHQVKGGFQFRYHWIQNDRKSSELGGAADAYYPMNKVHWDPHRFWPKELAFYLQDRIEFQGLIVNVGARVDAYDNNTRFFQNPFDPFDYVRDGDKIKDWKLKFGDKVGWKWFFSPRVGVSHPVSDRMAMHYAFGRYFQYPNFATLYTDYNLRDFVASPSTRTTRRDQDPVRSTSYEMGFQYAITRDLSLGATAYYRDIEKYSASTYTLVVPEGNSIIFTTTWGYADARGIEISLEKRATRWWGGRLSYAFSYVKASRPKGAFSTDFNASIDSTRYADLPWRELERRPQRETNVTVFGTGDPFFGTSSPVSAGFDRPHRISGTLLLFLPYDINVTAIGSAVSGFYYDAVLREDDPLGILTPEFDSSPWSYQLNLRGSKVFRLAQNLTINLFGEVRNVFNRSNILGIQKNGPRGTSADFDIWRLGRDGEPNTGDEQDPEGFIRQPTDRFGRLLYAMPRQIFVGAEITF
jgi:outer membrane receptor protein involved in Fe transport